MPYDTCRTQGLFIVDGGPLHHQSHVRGLATPFAAMPPASSRHRSVGASLGFALQGVPLARDGYSSRSPCPPDVTGCPIPPRRGWTPRPPPRLRSRGESVLPSPGRSRRTVDAFLGFPPSERSPHPSGHPLLVTGPTSSPSGGMTSRPAWASRFRESDGSALLVSEPPALVGFCTLQPSWHSIHGSGGGLMALPRVGHCLTGSADHAPSPLEDRAIACS